MSLTTDIPMSRIDARIPLSVRETIDRAAAMQGRTRTDFLIAAALEKEGAAILAQVKRGAGHCRAIACAPCAGRSANPCRRIAVGRNGSPVVLP